MTIDRARFFKIVRKHFGALTQGQVDGMNAILDHWEKRCPDGPPAWLAYMLATAWHETATKMQPVMETCRPDEVKNPSVETAIARLESSWARGKMPWVKTPYWRKNAKGLSYLGRGLPQLTHESNYRKLSPYCGADLVARPDLALEPKYAIPIMFEGMLRGLYTGHKLGDYFGVGKNDPVGARRIVNALESAAKIAGHHRKFLEAVDEPIIGTVVTHRALPSEPVPTLTEGVRKGGQNPPPSPDAVRPAPPLPMRPAPAKPPAPTPAPKPGFWARLQSFFNRTA